MHLMNLTPDRLPALYGFWQAIGDSVAFFYQVDFATWRACLLDFHHGYEGLRLTAETARFILAIEGQQIVGLVQFGQPSFSWDDNGGRIESPNIGVIRHFYFRPDQPAAFQALLQSAVDQLAGVEHLHAFFQAHGMSCNAWHGKLHPAHKHVEQLLLEHGFVVEQENPFYSLDLTATVPDEGNLTITLTADKETSQHFAAWMNGTQVGTAILHPMGRLTGGYERDVVYMRWIGIDREIRGQGLGSRFLAQLNRYYREQGYRYLHLDTASTNLGAQRFYEKHGFTYRGSTRSYVRR